MRPTELRDLVIGILVMTVLVLVLVAMAQATDCGGFARAVCRAPVKQNVIQQKVVQQKVAGHHDVYDVYEPALANYTFYFVGAPLRAESVIDYELERDPLYQEFLEFKRWQQAAGRAALPEGPPPGPRFDLQAARPVLTARCLKCHAGAAAKGGVDFTAELDPQTVLAAIGSAATGAMPPTGKDLSREELAALAAELAQ